MDRTRTASQPPPKVRFNSSPKHTVGVELEISLLDPDSGELVAKAGEVLERFPGSPSIKPELFQTIVELNTGICDTIAEVRRDLGEKLAELRSVTEAMGLDLICTGTHPYSDWMKLPISRDERYVRLVQDMAWPARRLLICGLHVHVGLPSGEHAIAVMNSLTSVIPHILALSASSPYWRGRDTMLASSRTKVFEGLPTAGLPPEITNWNEFCSLMRTLVASGSIASIQEIWWDIRPHPGFGTVEIRIADGVNTLTEVCAIAAFVQCLVARMAELYDAGEQVPVLRGWTVRENKWRATRYGDRAVFIRNERGDVTPIREHVGELVERMRPTAQRLGCAAELESVLCILDHRPSFVRQRRRFQSTGSLRAVVRGLVEEFSTDTPMEG